MEQINQKKKQFRSIYRHTKSPIRSISLEKPALILLYSLWSIPFAFGFSLSKFPNTYLVSLQGTGFYFLNLLFKSSTGRTASCQAMFTLCKIENLMVSVILWTPSPVSQRRPGYGHLSEAAEATRPQDPRCEESSRTTTTHLPAGVQIKSRAEKLLQTQTFSPPTGVFLDKAKGFLYSLAELLYHNA